MNRHQPYDRAFEECFEMLHRMSQDEHDALLREAGILDDRGDLAPRYRAPAEQDVKPSVANS